VRGAKHVAYLGTADDTENSLVVAFSYGNLAKTKAALVKQGYDDATFASVEEMGKGLDFEVVK
jgi:hypothetical protein